MEPGEWGVAALVHLERKFSGAQCLREDLARPPDGLEVRAALLEDLAWLSAAVGTLTERPGGLPSSALEVGGRSALTDCLSGAGVPGYQAWGLATFPPDLHVEV